MKKILFIVLLIIVCISQVQAQTQDFKQQKTDTVLPSFPGGHEALFYYLQNEVHCPVPISDPPLKGGVVYIGFTIDTTGTICCPEILRSPDPVFNKEAIRVVMKMPKWIPAYEIILDSTGNKYKRVIKKDFVLPIVFSLD